MQLKKEVTIKVTKSDPWNVRGAIREQKMGCWTEQRINLVSRKLLLISSFDSLQAIETKQCQIRIMPHQVGAAFRVMNEMGHRAILADEVGLGKTIEAGILIKEYLCRELVDSALILAPKSLLHQWKEEMYSKFNVSFVLDRQKNFHYDRHRFIIGTLEKARNKNYREQILSRQWGIVIIDEAHKSLRRPTNITYKFVDSINKKYFLLLTATPLQTNLLDLWSLSHLVNHGVIGSRQEFRERFVDEGNWERLKNSDQLGGILRKVIVRTRRSEAGVHFVDRSVEPCRIDGESNEYATQDAVLKWVQNEYSQPGETRRESAVQQTLLLREITSSIHAALNTLSKKYKDETREEARYNLQQIISLLKEEISRTELHSKAKKVLEIYEKVDEQKLLIFVQYKATQSYLVETLSARGLRTKAFQGNSNQRNIFLKWFNKAGKVLVCCDSTGAEGLNLQDACHIVVNYDLPWNPMIIEQRIGRVHRIGQKKDVQVFNLSIKDTIEDYILTILFQRVNLFRLAIGDMDFILGMNKLEGTDVPKMIAKTVINRKTRQDIKAGLQSVAEQHFSSDLVKFRTQLNSFHEEVFENFHLNAFDLKYSEMDNEA